MKCTSNTQCSDKTICRVSLYTAAGLLMGLGILLLIKNTSHKTDTKKSKQANTQVTIAFIVAALLILGGCVIPNSKSSDANKKLLNNRKQRYQQIKKDENNLLDRYERKQAEPTRSDPETGPAAT